MPRVKIDYVVSFSSEDPENQANNLLAWDVGKKMWLCSMGEPSCSVVLQLARAVKVESITIGTYHTALLEVLVGLSEKPDAPFEALVPRCAVLSPREARAPPTPRVRSFTREGLVSTVADRRWDRLRVVCSQPYDKHCKYGLSFVHIFEPETPRPWVPAAVSQRLLRLDALSEDEEEFNPGELFAKHSQELREKTSTDAQIRHATTQALKNIPDSSTKLMKTPISKTNNKDHNQKNSDCSNREKNSLLYTDDEEKPHARIDHVVQRHKDQKQKEQTSTKMATDNNGNEESCKNKKQSKEMNKTETKPTPKHKTPHKKDISATSTASSSNKKRKRSVDAGERGPAATILSGVVFSISGYVNPERSSLRDAAVQMGAQYRADWRPECTHLICAFPNTPRLRALRSSKSGPLVPATTGAWLTACQRAGRRLPWRAFATEPHLRDTTAEEDDEPTAVDDADGDTDDEIEKVLRQTKKKRTSPPSRSDDSDKQQVPRSRESPPTRDSPSRADTSNDSDVTFVRDERVLASVTVDSDDDVTDAYDDVTDQEQYEQEIEEIDEEKSLPLTLDGVSVSVCGLSPQARGVVSRYVIAYGGVPVEVWRQQASPRCGVDEDQFLGSGYWSKSTEKIEEFCLLRGFRK